MNKNTLVYIAITAFVFINFSIYSKIITDSIPDGKSGVSHTVEVPTDSPDAIVETEPEASPDSKFLTASVADTKSGSLILVNKQHGYTFDNTPSLTKNSSNVSVYGAKSKNYFVKDINVSLDEETITALNAMLDDFYANCGNKKNVIVTQGLRTYDEQQAMLELKQSQYGMNQTIAQTPGYSEHHTGYAIDISTYVNNVMGTFTGENEYKWVHDNAHKYGFILRYPLGKEDITEISYESWHFRYVGVPHAQYIYRNGLSLEEYITLLSDCTYGNALEIYDEVTAQKYSVYSVAVNIDGTHVPVPTVAEGTSYSLSGDNCGSIIVTVKEGVGNAA